MVDYGQAMYMDIYVESAGRNGGKDEKEGEAGGRCHAATGARRKPFLRIKTAVVVGLA